MGDVDKENGQYRMAVTKEQPNILMCAEAEIHWYILFPVRARDRDIRDGRQMTVREQFWVSYNTTPAVNIKYLFLAHNTVYRSHIN